MPINSTDFDSTKHREQHRVGQSQPMADRLGDGAAQSTLGVIVPETSEPSDADNGTVSFDGNTLRLKTADGWNSVLSRTGNPFLDPPNVLDAAAQTFNDEFLGGSADLAERGWTIKNESSVVLTRAGEIQPFVYDLPSNQYRSSIMGSTLQLQLSQLTSNCIIYKPAVMTNTLVFARLGVPNLHFGGATPGLLYEVRAWQNAAGQPDNANYTYAQLAGAGAFGYQWRWGWRSGAFHDDATLTSTNVQGGALGIPTILALKASGTNTWGRLYATDAGSVINTQLDTLVGTPLNVSNVSFLGLVVEGPGNVPATNGSAVVTIDYIRRVDGDSGWLAQP